MSAFRIAGWSAKRYQEYVTTLPSPSLASNGPATGPGFFHVLAASSGVTYGSGLAVRFRGNATFASPVSAGTAAALTTTHRSMSFASFVSL
jgi:hypothetical protein